MRPVLFHVFGVPVGAYGFFLSAAHFCGLLYMIHLARSRRLPLGAFLDVSLAVVVAGLVGARVGYLLTHWAQLPHDPWQLLSGWKNGLSFYGGFALAFAAFLAALRWRRLPVLETSDLICPVLPLSLAIVRLGCFAQGCCYGAPAYVPWAVAFHEAHSQVPPPLLHRPLHPTQLYEAAFLLLLASALALAQARNRLPAGVLATISVFAYSAYRFCADFFRGDGERGFLGLAWMSPTQGLALLPILATPVALWIAWKARTSQAALAAELRSSARS